MIYNYFFLFFYLNLLYLIEKKNVIVKIFISSKKKAIKIVKYRKIYESY